MGSSQPTLTNAMRRALKAAALSVWNVVDRACLRLTGQHDLPPVSLRKHVAPLHLFVPTVEEYIAYFKLLGDLRMSDTVLDIGCGTGRFAGRLLLTPHFFHGTYYGFDPAQRCIEWAKENIGRRHGNMHFAHIDLRNSYYNPTGSIDPATFAFPYPDNHFDFVFSWSIFTHLVPEVTNNYLRQIGRVLKPGKKALLTCMLLDGYPESLRKDIIEKRRLVGIVPAKWDHRGLYSVLYADQLEKVLAYQRDFFVGQIRKSDLVLVKTYNGAWNHLEDYVSEQDMVIVSKADA